MALIGSSDALREAIALEHLMYTEAAKHDRLAQRWRDRAELALKRGEEALAREALGRQAAEEARAAEYRRHYLEQNEVVRRAKRALTPSRPLRLQPSPEHRLNELDREDRLARDLAALKARLASRS